MGKRFLDFRRKSAWISKGIENTIGIPWGACFLFQETFSNEGGHQGCGQGGRRVAGHGIAGAGGQGHRSGDAQPRRRAVRRTGYLLNLAARRLRSRHSNTIGLIVADIRNPFFTAISRSVEDLAYARGLRVILCNTDENPEKEEMYLRLMEEERVLGAICAPTRRTAGRSGACGAVFR